MGDYYLVLKNVKIKLSPKWCFKVITHWEPGIRVNQFAIGFLSNKSLYQATATGGSKIVVDKAVIWIGNVPLSEIIPRQREITLCINASELNVGFGRGIYKDQNATAFIIFNITKIEWLISYIDFSNAYFVYEKALNYTKIASKTFFIIFTVRNTGAAKLMYTTLKYFLINLE